jgi:hypothetical protein
VRDGLRQQKPSARWSKNAQGNSVRRLRRNDGLNNKIVTGFGIRNAPEVPHFLENYFKKEVIGLQLVD